MKRKKVFKMISQERKYQDLKWNNPDNPDSEKTIQEWISYMEFHLEKAKRFSTYHIDEPLAEIRKVAALAVRTMEILGCPKREFNVDLSIEENKNSCSGNCDHCIC